MLTAYEGCSETASNTIPIESACATWDQDSVDNAFDMLLRPSDPVTSLNPSQFHKLSRSLEA